MSRIMLWNIGYCYRMQIQIGSKCQREDLRIEVQKPNPHALADDSMPLILLP